MKQITLSEPATTALEGSIGSHGPGDKLKIALVYNDACGKEWTDQVRNRLSEVVGEEQVHCTEWNIADLHDDRLFSEGIRALAKADVIAVGIKRPDQVPSAFYLWVNLWLQLRQGATGALIALVNGSTESTGNSNEFQDYLNAVARQGRLDFLLQDCHPPIEAAGLPQEELECAEAV